MRRRPIGHLLAKSSHGWLAIRFAHERGPLRIAGTSQRTRCGVVLTAFAGALPDLVGQPCAEQMGDAAQPRRRRRAAPRRTLSEQRKKPRTAAPAPAPVDEEAAAAEEAAPAPVDEEVAAAERLASRSGLRVGATVEKRFPGYGIHRGTVVELSAVDVVVNWETDERTTLSIKEASRRVIGAPVDEEAEEASSAPALASGGEEPPRLRVGGYAIENSTGRTVRILKHERWRAPSGREHERWHMQPLGRGWIDSRMMHPDLLTPCVPPRRAQP